MTVNHEHGEVLTKFDHLLRLHDGCWGIEPLIGREGNQAGGRPPKFQGIVWTHYQTYPPYKGRAGTVEAPDTFGCQRVDPAVALPDNRLKGESDGRDVIFP